MFLNAKNGNISIGNTDMDYVSFGAGNDTLIRFLDWVMVWLLSKGWLYR